jgi:hypothetical protein
MATVVDAIWETEALRLDAPRDGSNATVVQGESREPMDNATTRQCSSDRTERQHSFVSLKELYIMVDSQTGSLPLDLFTRLLGTLLAHPATFAQGSVSTAFEGLAAVGAVVDRTLQRTSGATLARWVLKIDEYRTQWEIQAHLVATSIANNLARTPTFPTLSLAECRSRFRLLFAHTVASITSRLLRSSPIGSSEEREEIVDTTAASRRAVFALLHDVAWLLNEQATRSDAMPIRTSSWLHFADALAAAVTVTSDRGSLLLTAEGLAATVAAHLRTSESCAGRDSRLAAVMHSALPALSLVVGLTRPRCAEAMLTAVPLSDGTPRALLLPLLMQLCAEGCHASVRFLLAVVTSNPNRDTTERAAADRTLSRIAAAAHTVDPTTGLAALGFALKLDCRVTARLLLSFGVSPWRGTTNASPINLDAGDLQAVSDHRAKLRQVAHSAASVADVLGAHAEWARQHPIVVCERAKGGVDTTPLSDDDVDEDGGLLTRVRGALALVSEAQGFGSAFDHDVPLGHDDHDAGGGREGGASEDAGLPAASLFDTYGSQTISALTHLRRVGHKLKKRRSVAFADGNLADDDAGASASEATATTREKPSKAADCRVEGGADDAASDWESASVRINNKTAAVDPRADGADACLNGACIVLAAAASSPEPRAALSAGGALRLGRALLHKAFTVSAVQDSGAHVASRLVAAGLLAGVWAALCDRGAPVRGILAALNAAEDLLTRDQNAPAFARETAGTAVRGLLDEAVEAQLLRSRWCAGSDPIADPSPAAAPYVWRPTARRSQHRVVDATFRQAVHLDAVSQPGRDLLPLRVFTMPGDALHDAVDDATKDAGYPAATAPRYDSMPLTEATTQVSGAGETSKHPSPPRLSRDRDRREQKGANVTSAAGSRAVALRVWVRVRDRNGEQAPAATNTDGGPKTTPLYIPFWVRLVRSCDSPPHASLGAVLSASIPAGLRSVLPLLPDALVLFTPPSVYGFRAMIAAAPPLHGLLLQLPAPWGGGSEQFHSTAAVTADHQRDVVSSPPVARTDSCPLSAAAVPWWRALTETALPPQPTAGIRDGGLGRSDGSVGVPTSGHRASNTGTPQFSLRCTGERSAAAGVSDLTRIGRVLASPCATDSSAAQQVLDMLRRMATARSETPADPSIRAGSGPLRDLIMSLAAGRLRQLWLSATLLEDGPFTWSEHYSS